MIRANAWHAQNVTAAIEARRLDEVKRIVDGAKLARSEFLSACARLGFKSGGVDMVPERDESVTSSPLSEKNPGLEDDPCATTLFFLDAEAHGGVTALALATTQNNVKAVRRLINEVKTG